MIVAPEEIRDRVSERCDVCVIGSGAGGAVVAKELAESGARVIVLEEGRHFTAGRDFNRRPIDMLARLYRDAGLTSTVGFPAIPLPLGRTVGGTTTINSGTCFRAPAEVLTHWERDLGVEGCGPEGLAAHFDRVERELHVVPVSEALLGRNAQIVRRGAERLGYASAPLKRNVRNCHGCGVCCFGCPSGAKQSMDVSYVPKAVAAGARVLSGCRAVRLVASGARIVAVEGHVVGPPGGAPGAEIRIEAGEVVLAAGAVHTPLLLQRNRLGLAGGQVGRHLAVHPCTRVNALFNETVDGWQGVPQGLCVDQFLGEGILLEGTQGPPSLIGAFLPFQGMRFKELFAQSRHVAAFGVMIRDSSRGSVRALPGGRPLIRYSMGPDDVRRVCKGILELSRIFFAAGARAVFPALASLPEAFSFEEVEARLSRPVAATELELMAFHPMGTCRMGPDPAASVVDPAGRVHGLENLHIADASVFPTNLGVNPQITISALADRLSARLSSARANRPGAAKECL